MSLPNREANKNVGSRRSRFQRSASPVGSGLVWTPVAWAAVVVGLFVIFAVTLKGPVAKAAVPGSGTDLDCVACHSVRLQAHSKLGSGNQACLACHANKGMSLLRLANGTELPLSGSSFLCAQCHQSRYEAWVSGTHGFPGFKEGQPETSSDTGTTCATCHDPHEPRIAFDFTKSHPESAPPPPAPPRDLLMMLGISLVAVGGAATGSVLGRGRV